MKRVLGLDLGTVTLGVAISRTGIISQGYEEFRFENERFAIALKEVKRIVELEKIEYIALGYPLNMDGSIGERAQCSIDFKKMIEDEIKGVNVVLIDERWTTKQATRFLLEGDLSRAKRKKVIDKMAAQVILDTYIQRGY